MSEEKIKQIKKIILQASYKTGEGHVPSAFSILDILYVLYHGGMNIDSANPDKKDRDCGRPHSHKGGALHRHGSPGGGGCLCDGGGPSADLRAHAASGI